MKTKKFYLFAISFLFICSILLAQDYTQIINFSKEDIKIVKNGDYDYLQFEDLEYSQEVGYPQLPMEIVQLSIPNDKEIADIQIEILESEFLDGSYNLFPKQSPQIFSKEETSFNNQNEEVYNSNEPYPKEIIKIENSGFLSRNKIATLTIFPLQYIPSERKLKFISSVKVNLIFKESSTKNIGFRESEYSNQIEIKSLTNLQNEKVELTEKEIDLISASLPSEEHLYLIITSDALESSFQPLANWKLQKGLSEKIVTTSFIYTNYSGRDDAEKVRNFIIDAYQTWGTVWVLLGGDITVVPHRTAYAMDCDGNHNDYIPCDLYYSDLDGNWDANANDIFGEVDDNIDMYPDVFVGRASVENSAEATAFVNKLLVYEKNPPTDYLLDMLFLGEVLWDDPYTDSGIGKDYIDNNYVPERFDPIIKLYESLGNESASNVISEINSGKGIINHNGHAWYDVMGTGIDYIHNYNMDYDLTNISKYGILYSIGCWPGAFDYDCIAEHFISNPNGGGIAFIGNSRYGWGCPGDPIYGYSDRFDQQFYKFLFQENVYNIGQTIASAKSMYVPLASEKNVYRWCEYEINLLGDPEMPIWTDVPKTLTINYPDSFIVGENSCLIAVTDGNNPVANAFVCLMQENGIYETGYTRIDGTINFRINITDPINYIKLTVTAQNYLPSQTDIPIQSNKQYIGIANCSTNGSEDRII
ncbi:MAG: hypothetical protein JXA68_04605, partial [Ignavibacteriales bacterium]|nr:hypothetical protein [Ignavibacteriales bacterium]